MKRMSQTFKNCYKYRRYDRIYTFIATVLPKVYYQKQEPNNKSVTFLKSLNVE